MNGSVFTCEPTTQRWRRRRIGGIGYPLSDNTFIQKSLIPFSMEWRTIGWGRDAVIAPPRLPASGNSSAGRFSFAVVEGR